MLKFLRNHFGQFGNTVYMAPPNGGGGGGGGQSTEVLAQTYLGRNVGPEFFASIAHNGTAQQQQIPQVLSLNRPLEAFILRWRGRVVIGANNYDAVAAEAPWTIIDRFQVQGTYKGNQLTPVFMTGGTLFTYMRLFQTFGNTALIGTTRQADPSSPYAQVGATFGNIGTYDLDLFYILPVVPMLAKAARARGNVSFLWQPQDWNNIQITVWLGDRTSFGTPNAGSTVTFTAFGSGAGSPSCEVYTRYELLGDLRGNFRTACVVRNESTIVSGQGLNAIANNVTLQNLTKQKTANLLVKTGINLTGVTSGVNVFASLTDTMLDQTQIVVDNTAKRNNLSNLVSKQSIAQRFAAIHPQGYLLFSFVDGQSPRSCFRADIQDVVAAQASYQLKSNVLTAAANQQANVIQEMYYADADDPYWQGTR